MPKKKLSPIITDSYVSPELNTRASVGFSAERVSSLANPNRINPLDAYRVTELDRWQTLHDLLCTKAERMLRSTLYEPRELVHVMTAAGIALDKVQYLKPKPVKPSVWSKVKAYWDGI